MGSSERPTKRGPTDPDFFSSARSFPITIGKNVRPGELHGYYVDLRFKAEAPSCPPPWLPPRDQQLHVSTAQFGLGSVPDIADPRAEPFRREGRDAIQLPDILLADGLSINST